MRSRNRVWRGSRGRVEPLVAGAARRWKVVGGPPGLRQAEDVVVDSPELLLVERPGGQPQAKPPPTPHQPGRSTARAQAGPVELPRPPSAAGADDAASTPS